MAEPGRLAGPSGPLEEPARPSASAYFSSPPRSERVPPTVLAPPARAFVPPRPQALPAQQELSVSVSDPVQQGEGVQAPPRHCRSRPHAPPPAPYRWPPPSAPAPPRRAPRPPAPARAGQAYVSYRVSTKARPPPAAAARTAAPASRASPLAARRPLSPALPPASSPSSRLPAQTSLAHFRWRQCSVIRRFRDFALLQTRLAEKNPGIIVPVLPEKNAATKLFSMSPAFVAARCAALGAPPGSSPARRRVPPSPHPPPHPPLTLPPPSPPPSPPQAPS